MSYLGRPITLGCVCRRTGAQFHASGIIRDDAHPLSFIVELTSGPQDGAFVVLRKDACRNLTAGESAVELPEEPEPGEDWKSDQPL